MLNRLPVEVNPFRLVEQKRNLSGVMPWRQLPRLQEIAIAGTGDFDVELVFTCSDVLRLPMIAGFIRGTVMLECQRCLQPVAIPLDCRLATALVDHDSDGRPEQEGLESCLVEEERLFLQDFIEDEILLALPMVAKHEQCEPLRPLIEALPTDELGKNEAAAAPTGRSNPFAVLQDWKKTE